MLNGNGHITYTFNELAEVLKEVEVILQSLHRSGSYYGEKFIHEEELYRREYEKETTRIIDEWRVCERLAKIRRILSEKFDDTLGEDDMDDLERAMENIKYWRRPGDMP
ncbi:hypothetical protein [Clostridium saccharoperbutylacetonicum]|uniref:hypothetical protein n=1 Tax=Clostridium saccharoperbutylacetonicum TaxID=36745 RepID=UPI0039EB52E0